MDLFTVLLNINEHSNTDILYVEQPWTLESNVVLTTKENTQPITCNNTKYEYFLEIFIIKMLFKDYETQNACLQDQCLKILEYAINKVNNNEKAD